jgi:hypothetical protein
MEPTCIDTLSVLLEQNVQPDPEAGVESAADACLVQQQFDDALSGYYQLDASTPRIATKVAYCEWMVGHYVEARDRLLAVEEELETDGIGLLCELILRDSDYKRRAADMETIWPRLQAIVASEAVPLIAATARANAWWPADDEDREQRHRDLERLLSLHPNSQHLRLSLAAAKKHAGASIADRHALLRAWQYPSPMPRYLWESAIVASEADEFDEALENLSQLEKCERRSESPSRNLLLNIALARCDIAVASNAPDAISRIDRLLSDESLNSDDRARVARVALAAACSIAPERISTLADNYLTALEAKEYGFSLSRAELTDEPFPIDGSGWDTYGESWSCGDLTGWRSVLIEVPSERARLFFRAAFCVAEIDAQYYETEDTFSPSTEWWDSLADLLGDVSRHKEEFGGRLLSLDAAIRAYRHRPNWARTGQDWIASEWSTNKNEHYDTHGWLTLQAVRRSKSSARVFTTGVIKQLRDNLPAAPLACDLVLDLIQILVDLEVRQELYMLMQRVAEGDDRPDVHFYCGLAASWTNRDVEARAAYAQVLEKQPNNHSAIFNSLLLCKTHSDTSFLDRLETFVAQYPEERQEEKQELSAALANARQRCEDKEAVKRELIRIELSKYPKLVENQVEPKDISLRAAVALLALFRCAKAQPGDEVLPPFEGCDTPFSSAIGSRRILFDLMQTGLIAVDPHTKLDAFSIKDGKVSGWFMGNIRWCISPAAGSLVERLRDSNGEIPDSWRREIESLALEIARGEIVEYLNHLANERGWPEPGNTEEVSDLTRALVNEVPVAQAFHLAYLGAMSASDYKQKYPVSRQQAADMLVKRTGQRLESLRDGRLAPRAYDRPWKLPRSAVSLALWGTILDMGDNGFRERIADAVANL